MKIQIKQTVDCEVFFLQVKAGARYWEDSEVNNIEDTQGLLIPCRTDDYWCPLIDLQTGQIVNWENGVTAKIHYKVCDDGIYNLLDLDKNIVLSKDGYVPDCLATDREGYGDYIIMNIDEKGFIENWKFYNDDVSEFQSED